jgi:hypothetical protein
MKTTFKPIGDGYGYGYGDGYGTVSSIGLTGAVST